MERRQIHTYMTSNPKAAVLQYMQHHGRPWATDFVVAMYEEDELKRAALLRAGCEKYPDKWEFPYFLYETTYDFQALLKAYTTEPMLDHFAEMSVYNWKLYRAMMKMAPVIGKKDLAVESAIHLATGIDLPQHVAEEALLFLQQAGVPWTALQFDTSNVLAKIDKVLYINMDSRPDRRVQMERTLKEIGFPADKVERVPGVAHEIGGVGCTAAHINCLELAQQRGYKNILVLEDDFQPDVSKRMFWEKLGKLFSENIKYDVVMLAYNHLKSEPHKCPMLRRAREVSTSSAYLLNCDFLPTLLDCLKSNIELFKKTRSYEYTIDIAWQTLQKSSEWLIFKRRLSTQREGYSNILRASIDYGC